MELQKYFPVWDKLEPSQQAKLASHAVKRHASAGEILHNGSADCMGVMVITNGQLRAYSLSEEGRQITLYRLLERDVCLFSASCMLSSIRFDIIIEAEKPTDVWVVSPEDYRQVMESSAALANYTNQLMATRFTDVMWLVEQVMWKSQDKRLAAFLLEESSLEDSLLLCVTHDKIANHLGTAREVVTRMLRYFQSEGMVKLTRGSVELTDVERLEELAR